MEKSIALNSNEALLELSRKFTLDELDDWRTTAGLVESAVALIESGIPGSRARIFAHVQEAREYREIEREGLAAIPDDSLFAGCLAMQSAPLRVDEFFSDYALDDPLLERLLAGTYGGDYLVPVVHRFSLLAFVLLSTRGAELTAASRKLLVDVAARLRINLYAASIADRRQRELLRLAEFPEILHARSDVGDLSRRVLDDLRREIPFDVGVYYEYDEYLKSLKPVVWAGVKARPARLRSGDGISGLALERGRAIFVPERSKHPSFADVSAEAFIAGSLVSAPVKTDKRVFGVVTLSRRADNAEGFGVEDRYTLEIAAALIATELGNRLLYDELEQSYFATVSSLTRALEAKDRYTRGHSERVMRFAEGIARTLDLSPEAIRKIRYGAILHDIGKIGVSDSIISKPSRLTDSEFAEIKRHTEIGYEIVNDGGFLGEIRDLIRYHHEKMDGTGYNEKRNGDYPWEAMIISIADIFDALASDRPYRAAYAPLEALAALEELVGVNFDRRVYDAFKTWLVRNVQEHGENRRKGKRPKAVEA